MDPDNSRYVRTEEWKKERVKIIRFIVTQQMATLTYEDLAQHTRGVFHERYYYMSDERLLEVFEKENGIITEDMVKLRPGYEKRLGET
tara:strand:+ start:254 stop:517 length:264 start_codon:yes stop_codon:yes gene_type:complete